MKYGNLEQKAFFFFKLNFKPEKALKIVWALINFKYETQLSS